MTTFKAGGTFQMLFRFDGHLGTGAQQLIGREPHDSAHTNRAARR